jgi:hypothetical protein
VASDGRKTQAEARKERLAAALRENLKRRKAQARAKAPKAPDTVLGTAPQAGLEGAAEPTPNRPNPAANRGQ